ncbi:hypothetical protein FB446DRAFT_774933 [Lentinula raphanica]|nr:hypothetical protein FB446DRAFT_774933 [Lentinula raphanica]
MSLRSFTVFVDTPAVCETDTNPKPTTQNRLARSLSEPSISSILSPIFTTDKENLDPVTGERVVSSTSSGLGKKRKGSISVLAVKTMPGPKLPKDKDVSALEAQPEAKKRKSSVSSSSITKTKSKKDLKAPSSGKKTAKKISRRAAPLPKLDEEGETEKEQTSLSQTMIDSKCYDLTVKPLADVSKAYEPESGFEEKDAFQFVKERSADPEIRDYFPSSSLSSFASSTTTLRGSSPAELKTFSTPERKQIYSAFTFTSPSPTSERIARSKRSASMPPLDFGAKVQASP